MSNSKINLAAGFPNEEIFILSFVALRVGNIYYKEISRGDFLTIHFLSQLEVRQSASDVHECA